MILQPQLITADEETIRVSTKLLVTIVFKANNQRVFMGENLKDSQVTPHTEELFAKLGLDYKQEKSQVRVQLAELMDRLGQFELQKIASGGYIHFMHLLS